MPKRFFIAVIVLLLSLSLAGDSYSAVQKREFQKGMNYVTSGRERFASKYSDASLKTLSKTGTKWVALVVNWYQESCSSTEISPAKHTSSDESVIHAIKTIRSLGMQVMLKPHIDLIDTSGGGWRGEISCASDDWDEWFDSYGKFMIHYANIAQEYKVDMFCIGTELSSVSIMKESLWKEKVIGPVKGIYTGPLIYAANWDEEYQSVVFWDEMDYVGIDAYFPLSDKERPTYKEILKGWDRWVVDIEEFQAKVDKPIVFTETGYCSASGATKKPWEEVAKGSVDMALQADCYKALMKTFWRKRWFYGVYWWRWGTSVRFGGPTNRGFSPQNKTAQNIMKRWYNKYVPSKTYGR